MVHSTPRDLKEKKKALAASKAERRVMIDQLARDVAERARSNRPLTDEERKSAEAAMAHKSLDRAERSVLERALKEAPSVEAAEKKQRVASAVRHAVACCVHGDIFDAVAEIHKHVSPYCEDADRFKIAEDIPAHVHAAFLELGFEEAAVQSCRRLLDDVTGLLVGAVRGETTLTLAAGDLAVLERHMPDAQKDDRRRRFQRGRARRRAGRRPALPRRREEGVQRPVRTAHAHRPQPSRGVLEVQG